jgi:hypothetical protein
VARINRTKWPFLVSGIEREVQFQPESPPSAATTCAFSTSPVTNWVTKHNRFRKSSFRTSMTDGPKLRGVQAGEDCRVACALACGRNPVRKTGAARNSEEAEVTDREVCGGGGRAGNELPGPPVKTTTPCARSSNSYCGKIAFIAPCWTDMHAAGAFRMPGTLAEHPQRGCSASCEMQTGKV